MEQKNTTKSELSHKYEAVNPIVVFPIIAMSLLMITVDSTIVATALHALQVDLQTSVSWAGWTLTIYSFGFVVMLPLSAKLSIQFGHRRIFLSSIAMFTIASLLCGFSTNIYMLVAMRALQAIGGAGITPSATGPIFGGLFVTYSTWHWIFFINIPIGIAVFLLAMRFIPQSQPNSGREKLDFAGMLYLAGGIITAMYAVTYLGERTSDINISFFTALILTAIVFFSLFFRHIKRVKFPFIKPRFIYGKGFGAVNLVNFIQTGMVIGGVSLIPLYAVSRYGISQLHSGTLLVGEGIASVVMSVIMSIYLRRTGYRLPIYI